MSDEKKNNYQDLEDAINYGVERDKLSIPRITFWSVFGIAVFIVLVVGVSSLYHSNKFIFQESISTQYDFNEINKLRAASQERLNSAGILDEEEGVYHIPIEEAFNIYLNETEN